MQALALLFPGSRPAIHLVSVLRFSDPPVLS